MRLRDGSEPEVDQVITGWWGDCSTSMYDMQQMCMVGYGASAAAQEQSDACAGVHVRWQRCMGLVVYAHAGC